jgi:hypothetical protein
MSLKPNKPNLGHERVIMEPIISRWQRLCNGSSFFRPRHDTSILSEVTGSGLPHRAAWTGVLGRVFARGYVFMSRESCCFHEFGGFVSDRNLDKDCPSLDYSLARATKP